MSTSYAATNYGTNNSPVPIFLHLMQILTAAQCDLHNDYPLDRSNEVSSSTEIFDFVIVGAGSAGSVVANRLSEINDWKVLLIEAGTDSSVTSEVPGLFPNLIESSEDYSYYVEPEEHACHATVTKRCRWSKGKALGGSSAINAMLYIYGNEKDYNDWSDMGNTGWSYEEVLPYFKKSQDCIEEHNDGSESKYCGHEGPLSIRYYNNTESHKLNKMFQSATREINVPSLDMINSDKFIGYGLAKGTLNEGRRMSTAKAFLAPIKDRQNLYVMKSTRADAILMEDKEAVGVRVTLKNGTSVNVKASKEVILSAGSIASPQLLMLSGIGPKEHLDEMGIPSVVDLPVGKNLQDHVIWFGTYLAFENQSVTPPAPTFMLDEIYQYLIYKRNSLSTSSGYDFLGFINVNNDNAKYPDIQFHHFYLKQWETYKVRPMMKVVDLNEEMVTYLETLTTKTDIILTLPTLLKPQSLGEIKLRSKNPADPVKIYANYFSVQEDLNTMMKSLKFLKKMANTEAWKQQGISFHIMDIPDCQLQHMESNSEEYLKCNIQHMTNTVFHPVGTAKMAPQHDPTAVVDARLRVHGMQGLRVIDASIMPTITSGNTNAPSIMIGEKGAEMIKQDWKIE